MNHLDRSRYDISRGVWPSRAGYVQNVRADLQPSATEHRGINDISASLLEQLPDELLLSIVQQLEVERGFLADVRAEVERQCDNAIVVQTLHALTLTSWRLTAITTPQLYKCIIWSVLQIDLVSLLLRSLVQRPGLARHIEYFEVERLLIEALPEELRCMYSKENLYSFQQILTGNEWMIPDVELPGLEEEWPLRLSSQDFTGTDGNIRRELLTITHWGFEQDPLCYAAAILVLCAPNLTMLVFDYTENFLDCLVYKNPSLHRGMRTLLMRNKPVGSLITAKSTSHMSTATQDFIRRYYERYERPVEEYTVLQELSLSIVDMNMAELSRIISACPGLERFSCRWRTVESSTLQSRMVAIDFSEWRAALSAFYDSLVFLELDTVDAGILTDLDQDIPAFGSFRDFTKLTHLNVSGLVLWGDYLLDEDSSDPELSTILPVSLESLKITVEWDFDVEQVLLGLLPECKTALPALTKIDCSWSPAPRPIASFLTSSFRKRGVELILQISDV